MTSPSPSSAATPASSADTQLTLGDEKADELRRLP